MLQQSFNLCLFVAVVSVVSGSVWAFGADHQVQCGLVFVRSHGGRVLIVH